MSRAAVASAPPVTLRGRLARIRVERGAWFAGEIETADKKRHVIAGVASGGVPPIDSEIEVSGVWEARPPYGDQLKFSTLTHSLPSTKEGTLRFLATLPGIGPTRALAIWDTFGADSARVVTETPSELRRVKGLARHLEDIEASIDARRESIHVEQVLCSMQFGPGTRRKIMEEFGDGLARVIRENPYRLVTVPRVTFHAVDNAVMAMRLMAPESPFRAAAAVLQALKDAAEDGHTWIEQDALPTRIGDLRLALPVPEDALARGIATAVEHGMVRRIVRAADGAVLGYAVPALADAEEMIAERLAAMLREDGEAGSLDNIPAEMREALVPEQLAAVENAIKHRVSLLTGGPGTGKTFTTKSIIAALLAAGDGGILIAAPTGKAAKRAKEVTGNEAMTMHRLAGLLGRAAEGTDDGDREEPHVLIIDEASMADVETLAMLLGVLSRRDLRLVIVGDVDQLPSVGPGRVLADLLDSGAIPTVRLTRIMRQAAESRIIANAHALNSGLRMNHEPSPRDDWFFIRGAVDGADVEVLATRVCEAVERAEARWGYRILHGEVLVLAGQQKSPLGVGALNKALRARFNPPQDPNEIEVRGAFGEGFRVGDRVLVTSNDYSIGVVNGDVGMVASVLPPAKDMEGKAIAARVTVRLDDGTMVEFIGDKIDVLRQAWAMTVHKAQGSEAPMAIVVCHTVMSWACQRCLLYTAITRGRERVCLVGTEKAVGMATSKVDTQVRFTRLTGLVRSARRAMGGEA